MHHCILCPLLLIINSSSGFHFLSVEPIIKFSHILSESRDFFIKRVYFVLISCILDHELCLFELVLFEVSSVIYFDNLALRGERGGLLLDTLGQ